MESHPYETTIFNAVASCIDTVQTAMRAGTPGSVSVDIVDQKIAEVVASAQATLDMLYEAEDF